MIDLYIYQRIRDLREDSDMTQEQVAKILGLQTTTYRRYEVGERECPTHIIIKLCFLYNTTADYILGITNEKRKIK